MTVIRWAPERQAELTRMWAEGLSQGLIAERLGATRSAVSGQINRLKLPKRKGTLRKDRHGNVMACSIPPKPKVAVVSNKRQPPSRTFSAPPPAPSLEMVFRAAEKDGCRWMSGDPREMLFCGDATVRGGSYCEAHHARAYRAVAA